MGKATREATGSGNGENARQTYSQSLIPKVYVLSRKCDNLLDVMQNWIESRK
jgi:hypothetical protein